MKLGLTLLLAAALSISFNTVATAQAAKPECEESGDNIGAADSTQITYFNDLLSRADQAPIEDFLHLWYPERDQTVDGGFLIDCLAEPNQHLRYVGGVVDQNCRPDTLYSWEPWSHVTSLIKTLPAGGAWSGGPNQGSATWATLSAVSTYSYGSTAIRLKIKAGTDYVDAYYSPLPTQISYPSNYPLQDFIINNGGVFDSYSYGTPEIYDEIVRDITRLASGSRSVNYSGSLGTMEHSVGMRRVYGAGVAERGPQDELTLRNRLKTLIQSVLSAQGKIVYANGVCQNRALHYQTRLPTYINPRTAP